MAVKHRKKALEEKKTEALQQALKKFTLCPNGLTVPEMKALVTAATTTSDSPVKKVVVPTALPGSYVRTG